MIEDIHAIGFSGNADRHGIWFDGTGGNSRGNWISRCSLRNSTGHAVFLNGASDSTISDCHVSSQQDGFRIAGGSTRLLGNKAFYCDSFGFNITSSRVHMTGNNAQDCASGVNISSANFAVYSMLVDVCQDDGIVVSGSRGILEANIYHRPSARYATMARGLTINPGANDNVINAVIDAANITTAVSYNGVAITTANQSSLPASYYRVAVGSSVITKG